MELRRHALAILASAFVFAPSLVFAASANLVANPGFEQTRVVDHIKAKEGFAFDCQIVKRTDKAVAVKTRAATVTWDLDRIEGITKRNVVAGWTFYEIVLPINDVADEKQGHRSSRSFRFQTDKGKGFLHSTPFAVQAGKQYELSVWVKGTGQASAELLWWTKYDADEVEMCKHHQDIVPAAKAGAEWVRIGKTFSAPEGATKAYVRLVAEAADVWLDNVSVVER